VLIKAVKYLRVWVSVWSRGYFPDRFGVLLKNVTMISVFFNIFIVNLRDFVLSRENCNLRWTRALRIKLDSAPGGQKQLNGGMGVGVPILRNSRVGLMVM
jgi:hypothetical protein